MALFRTSTYTNGLEQTVNATACYVTSIIIQPAKNSATNLFLRLYNVVNPAPETDRADFVVPIRAPGATALSSVEKLIKVIFPNRGLQFDTACTMLVTQTTASAVVPVAADAPTVEIHFAPIL